MPHIQKKHFSNADIKIIKNKAAYSQAIERVSALMNRDTLGSREENELELLALVIEDYERKIVSPVRVDAISAILFRMEQMQLSRKDLIPFLGSASKVSEVLSHKRSLSLKMILRLSDGLGIPADILIHQPKIRDCSSLKQNMGDQSINVHPA